MRLGKASITVSVGLGALLVSCGVYMSEDLRVQKVSDRAKFDLSCPSVSVVKISETSYGATGCDKKMSYVLDRCETPSVAKECTVIADAAQSSSAPAGSTMAK